MCYFLITDVLFLNYLYQECGLAQNGKIGSVSATYPSLRCWVVLLHCRHCMDFVQVGSVSSIRGGDLISVYHRLVVRLIERLVIRFARRDDQLGCCFTLGSHCWAASRLVHGSLGLLC
jgi:hypothetical protein